jgi:UDP-glucose 4-epimerase
MSKCLITGHMGFIGSELFSTLKTAGHEVMGIDLKEGNDILEVLKEGNIEKRYLDFQPDYVFHLACIPRVAYSVEYPVETMRNNVLAGSLTLNYALSVGAKRVIYAGSSSVVGNGEGPASPYALQKLVTEQECRIYAQLYDIDTVTLRYFNVYSESKMDGNPYATAIAKWRYSIENNIIPFITGDGEQRRDMAYLEDVVSANIFAMEQAERFNGEFYDIGTGSNISLNEIKDIILKNNPNIKFDYVAPRSGDVMFTKADIEKIKKLGWNPSMSIREGVERCFRVKN